MLGEQVGGHFYVGGFVGAPCVVCPSGGDMLGEGGGGSCLSLVCRVAWVKLLSVVQNLVLSVKGPSFLSGWP